MRKSDGTKNGQRVKSNGISCALIVRELTQVSAAKCTQKSPSTCTIWMTSWKCKLSSLHWHTLFQLQPSPMQPNRIESFVLLTHNSLHIHRTALIQRRLNSVSFTLYTPMLEPFSAAEIVLAAPCARNRAKNKIISNSIAFARLNQEQLWNWSTRDARCKAQNCW